MLKFRKDINGLRALAVISVVLYHFNIPLFSGGFAGVDIFFVISGYLMTGIIFSRLNSNEFSLLGFYLDRARRIIPALSFTCLTVFVFCWFFLTPTDFETLGKHIYSSLLFFSNVIYFKEVNYFDIDATQKWLLHTWSLSVEWQFYIIFPLLLSLIFKINRCLAKPVIIALFIVSFLWSVYLTINGLRSEAFYLLPSRAWEMLLGGIVYLTPIDYKNKWKISLHYTSMIVMLICIFTLNKFDLWPGYLAAIPVLSAALLISSSHDSFIFRNYISQFIGKISYSVYLCHWPIVVALGYFGLNGYSYVVLGIALSFFIGTISFYMIENPTRKFIRSTAKTWYKEITIIILIISIPLSLSVYANKNGGFPSRFPYALLTSKEISNERARYWVDGDKENPVPKTGDKKIVIIGNSHGIDLTYALTNNGMKGDITYIRTTSYCSNFGYTPNRGEYKEQCNKAYDNAIKNNSLKDADVVFLHDDWAIEDISGFKKSINNYRSKTNAKIYIVGPKMTYTINALDVVSRAMKNKSTTASMINDFSSRYYSANKIKTNSDLESLMKNEDYINNDIFYISALDIQCGKKLKCELISARDKSFNYFDAGHFTLNGSINFGSKLKESHPELFN
ncbi:acyltransferase family protein [Providencia sp. JUb39]|uniref:acyltransferase family protein n=1 Tax=Providencia sp. JUb39 TaxID=2724165 RepID=UPI00164D0CFD|nr:acyltransferase family protein [Providencia sp. JUb39]MBC5790633.1 acyltransferase [Providencia sp. JUb39]